jgi:DNA-binding transcriptional ArsR family regulator
MRESPADVLLHPVRLRIVRAFASAADLTVAELAESLADVPPATLYRHVNKLARSGLIVSVSERAVRGATERRYRLARRSPAEATIAGATRADNLRYFISFLAALIDDFSAYLESGDPDFERDGVGYRQLPLRLSDAEFRRMFKILAQAVAPFAALPPSPKRTPRVFTTIVMPARPRPSPT